MSFLIGRMGLISLIGLTWLIGGKGFNALKEHESQEKKHEFLVILVTSVILATLAYFGLGILPSSRR